MPVHVALLRAINVGGTGKLPMSDLRALCEGAGFEDVATYIQSGNVVFTSRSGKAEVQRRLEAALEAKVGKPVCVHLRTPAELASVLELNPVLDAPGRLLLFSLLGLAPLPCALDVLVVLGRESVRLSGQEVFIHFRDDMGRSKLKIPFAKTATGRNVNTVAKLLE